MSSLIMGLVWEMPVTKAFTSKAKFISLAYADNAWQDGTHAYPSIELVSRKTGIHERTVQRHIRRLVKIGVLIPAGKGPRGTNQFSFPLVQVGDTVKLEIKSLGGDTVTPLDLQGVSNEKDGGVTPQPPESLSPESVTPELKVVLKNLNQDLVVVNPVLGEISTLYESEIGALTPMIADAIRDAVDTYPADWIPEAMTIAVEGNHRSWKYVEGILKNCQAKKIRPSLNKLPGNKSDEKPASRKVRTPANNEAAIQEVVHAG